MMSEFRGEWGGLKWPQKIEHYKLKIVKNRWTSFMGDPKDNLYYEVKSFIIKCLKDDKFRKYLVKSLKYNNSGWLCPCQTMTKISFLMTTWNICFRN